MTNWSKFIPGETKLGQTMLFPPTAFKAPKPKPSDMRGTAFSMKPPFKPSGTGRPAPGDSARLARAAELRAKKQADIKAAVGEISAVREQSSKLVKAVNAGNATPMEGYKGMGILNNRMSRVTSSLPKSSFNSNTAAAKDAINQANKIDDAMSAGQITNREMYRQNRILMKRRKRAGI